MTKLWAVAYYTFRESFARKTFIAFFAISTLTMLLFLFALNLDIVDGAMQLSVFGQEAEHSGILVRELITGIQTGIAGGLFWLGLALAIFATASVLPNMLQKGHIEWILSKPISRLQLLLGKYAGALGIVGFNVFYLIGGSWLILSLKSGVWNTPFLFSGVLIVLLYGVLLAFMMLLGVLMQNSAIAIMGVFMLSFLSSLLAGRDQIYALLSKKIYQLLLDGVYALTPRISDIFLMVTNAVLGKPIADWMPLWHSLALGIFFFAITAILFKRKDF